MQAVRPRSMIVPSQIVLHHHFSPRLRVDPLYAPGFWSPYAVHHIPLKLRRLHSWCGLFLEDQSTIEDIHTCLVWSDANRVKSNHQGRSYIIFLPLIDMDPTHPISTPHSILFVKRPTTKYHASSHPLPASVLKGDMYHRMETPTANWNLTFWK